MAIGPFNSQGISSHIMRRKWFDILRDAGRVHQVFPRPFIHTIGTQTLHAQFAKRINTAMSIGPLNDEGLLLTGNILGNQQGLRHRKGDIGRNIEAGQRSNWLSGGGALSVCPLP